MRSLRLTAITALMVGVAAGSAQADVIEISPAGEVSTYSAPMVFTDDGASPVLSPEASPPQPVGRSPVLQAISRAASQHTISPQLLEAVAWQESRLRQDAVSPKGAVGVMQLMPGTAQDLRVDRLDLDQNVSGGAAYLSRMLRRYGGDLQLALAAYNAGPGAVDRHRGVPPFAETRAYVAAILERLAVTSVGGGRLR
jgi:soluble lytic murein transglycosylase-like protein